MVWTIDFKEQSWREGPTLLGAETWHGFIEDSGAFLAETQVRGFDCLRPTCSEPGHMVLPYQSQRKIHYAQSCGS